MAVKVYGVRLEEEVIEEFKKACLVLPIALKPSALIDGYMKSIIDASKVYQRHGDLDLEIRVSGNSFFKMVSGNNKDFFVSGDLVTEVKKDD